MQQQLTLKYWVHSEKSFLPLNPQKGTFKLADFQLFPFQGSGVITIENKNSYFSEWTQYCNKNCYRNNIHIVMNFYFPQSTQNCCRGRWAKKIENRPFLLLIQIFILYTFIFIQYLLQTKYSCIILNFLNNNEKLSCLPGINCDIVLM